MTDPALRGGQAAIVQSPRIEPGETLTFDATVTGLGTRSGRSPSSAPTRDRAATASAADLAFATDLAREAGRLLMERYERVERVDYKSARDIVTEVDHLSEELIIAAIRERHPGDGILAEESGDHAERRGPDGRRPATAASGSSTRVDGTINYANGIPFFCVSIALAVDGRPSVGVVFDPTRDELFAARPTGRRPLDGSRRSRRPTRTS